MDLQLRMVQAAVEAQLFGRASRPVTVGRYTVQGPIGSGGMGSVVRAHDPELQREVALKLVRAERMGNPGTRERLVQEARAMARLSHPNVAMVFEVGEADGHLYVAMELVDGRDLRAWLDQSSHAGAPRPWRAALELYGQAGRGLAAAHAKGLIHRDFKPENVVVDAEGRARVVDFGLARELADAAAEVEQLATHDEVEPPDPGERTDLTTTGTLLGTPAYMSPEQWHGRAVDARSDQFSFCVALWEALHGQRPFAGTTLGEIMLAVTRGRLVEPRASAVPRRVDRALRRGLAVEPADRWPDMDALLTALRPRGRGGWLLGGVAAVALAGMAAAVLREQESAGKTCLHEHERLAGTWDEATLAAAAAGVRATALPYAEDVWTALAPRLESYASEWVEAAREPAHAWRPGTSARPRCRAATMRRTAALRRTLAAASLLAAFLPGTAAAADEVAGTRSAALVERSHEIRLVVDHGSATLRVRRAVWNGGERHDQAEFWIDVPERSVAVGLRTKGMLHGRPHWFEGELLEAEFAAARYRELTGIGGYYPKDPALLSWRDPTRLALQVFPVAPQSEKMVEYTLLLPTSYADGRDRLELPALGTEAHPARVRLETVHPRDQLFVDEEPVARGHELVLEHVHDVALARHRPPRVDAELASVPFSDDGVLMRWDVALAPRLSTIPRNARVVVVLDGSRSWSIEQRRDAREVARAYLEHFAAPELRARVEVLVFDRKVHARHGKLVDAKTAIADLAHLEPADANGSHVDAALARAAEVLEAAPSGPRRILLLTDTRTRSEVQPARLRELAARSGAIVHVGLVEDDELSLVRADDHPWARVATATEGLVWQIGAHSGVPRDDMRAAFEELARPLRIDHLELSVPPLDDPMAEIPDVLDEGQGLEAFAIVDAPVQHLRIQGQLWSAPLEHTVLPDEDAGRRWAALVFGSELLDELDEQEMMTLALRGGAVSPVTSYLAIEPGVRPSTEGLEEGEGSLGLGSIGLIGKGGGGGTGSGFGRGSGPDRRQELLEQRVREALDTCGGRKLGTHLELESTLDEIVEIDHVELRGSADATVTACLEERVWATMLPSEFDDEWQRWVIDLPAA